MRAALLTVLLALLLTACDGFSLSFGGLDTGPLEAEIAEGIEAEAAGVRIDHVECPRNVQPQAGRVFVCRAISTDGSVGTVEVLQVDDEGAVEWSLTDVAAPSGGTRGGATPSATQGG